MKLSLRAVLAAGLLAAAADAVRAAGGAAVLPFIEDDYSRAVAQARERKLPLFIEAWAPW